MTEQRPTADLAEPAPSCCAPEAQVTCCEASDKASCCGAEATAAGGCGCSASKTSAPEPDVRELVRERYAAAATRIAHDGEDGACCGAAAADLSCCGTASTCSIENAVFGAALYRGVDAATLAPALTASLGCGVPTTVADLHEGETVLDLGSGAGADVLISARRVGPTGKAIGLDMTDEMLDLARRNAATAGVTNVEFVKGYIEQVPLEDSAVDVVISNCVLNLSADKPAAIHEAARVLRDGGRFAISDVIADEDMDDTTRTDMRQWTGCIAGALTRTEFAHALADAGFVEIDINETHRVHEYAAAAIIRARKPAAA